MPYCNNCGLPFDWGWDSERDRWVLLEPADTDRDLFKSFVDEDGNYRADHRDRCNGNHTVTVMRLKKLVPPEQVLDVPEADIVGDDVGAAQDAIASETGWFARMRGKK